MVDLNLTPNRSENLMTYHYDIRKDLNLDNMTLGELTETGFAAPGMEEDWVIISTESVPTKNLTTVLVLSEMKGWYTADGKYYSVPKENRRTQLEMVEFMDLYQRLNS
jgi:hypothetical protein